MISQEKWITWNRLHIGTNGTHNGSKVKFLDLLQLVITKKGFDFELNP